jgi:hypothetical protein
MFADTVDHEFAWQIDNLTEKGILKGYPDGLFRPDHLVTRAEFVKILMLAVYGNEPVTITNVRCFPDFVGKEQWYWIFACMGKEKGIVQGYPDKSFGALKRISTAEALKMSVVAWKIPLPLYFRAPDNWYDPYLDAAASRGVFSVVPHYADHLLTRGEVAALVVALGTPPSNP